MLCEQIYFQTASSRIHRRSVAVLDKLARYLRTRPQIRKLRIESHTDARGLASYNRRISQDRADAIRAHLVARGITPRRLEAVGVGEDRPVDPRPTPEARARNRRVELHIP